MVMAMIKVTLVLLCYFGCDGYAMAEEHYYSNVTNCCTELMGQLHLGDFHMASASIEQSMVVKPIPNTGRYAIQLDELDFIRRLVDTQDYLRERNLIESEMIGKFVKTFIENHFVKMNGGQTDARQ